MEKGGDNIDHELNKAFQEEGGGVVRKEIKKNEQRLGDIRATLRALDRFGGDGLADAMPLGEAVGFLEVKLEMAEHGSDPGMSIEDLTRARDFLADIIGEEYPEKMELGEFVKKLEEEEKEILS